MKPGKQTMEPNERKPSSDDPSSIDKSDVSKIVVLGPLEVKNQNSSSVEAVRTTFINSEANSI